MPKIECCCCGFSLSLPEDFPEAAPFSCGNCGLILNNVEAARRFKWMAVDPYVRRCGASRVNLWGGFIGSILWLPLLSVVLYAKGSFDFGMLAALGGPYLVMLYSIWRMRPRTPASLWVMLLWACLGGYAFYLWVLFALVPQWGAVGLAAGGRDVPVHFFGVFGGTALLVGVFGSLAYRRRAARLPKMEGTPPPDHQP